MSAHAVITAFTKFLVLDFHEPTTDASPLPSLIDRSQPAVKSAGFVCIAELEAHQFAFFVGDDQQSTAMHSQGVQ